MSETQVREPSEGEAGILNIKHASFLLASLKGFERLGNVNENNVWNHTDR